jgi:arylamine N-acetyltransferase
MIMMIDTNQRNTWQHNYSFTLHNVSITCFKNPIFCLTQSTCFANCLPIVAHSSARWQQSDVAALTLSESQNHVLI